MPTDINTNYVVLVTKSGNTHVIGGFETKADAIAWIAKYMDIALLMTVKPVYDPGAGYRA